MRKTALLALLALTASLGAAQTGSAFDAGNAAYQRGDYASARQQYLAQLQAGPATPALLYNLGNASLKLQQPGWAMLYYEQAALYIPRDRNLRANLAVALASRRVPPSAEAPGWFEFVWQNVRQSFTLNELTGAAVALYLLSCGLLLWRLRARDFRRRTLWLLLAALILFALVGAMTVSKWQADWSPARAVVVADGTLYSGPADTFPAVRAAYQGELMRTLRHEGLWTEVALENGSQGWLLQSAVEPVVR